MLPYVAGKSDALVSKGRHLHDNITYYDASVVQTFVGTESATQHECMLLAELAPLCTDGSWAGRITACLASEALVFFISLIADGPHHYHPACGHKGSPISPRFTPYNFFLAMQVQHSYNSSTNG